ncbi:hypothetical protein CMQ_6033 [Grosmannia clavigera kw1407]|uniref:Inner membrane assembly complex subunit 17 n=1 Tax=Grosmannia clavigera (strain kw1407 / UAMH 11150) TaxID=655863 RepID=F0XM72_GROCL|nr:uncharacterized protein CMQ_6033 [Grosmannia clavigera kw1407]EFX01091.1 hypothetical protein CMQ_6033 [Grosmannia clavigera kw1407]
MLSARLMRAGATSICLRSIPAAARLPLARRWNSSLPPQPPQPPKKQSSANTAFWKEFGRPIAKVLLMAVFTYQLAYYGWARLEQDEIRSARQAEVDALEAQVKDLQDAQKKATQP